MPAPAPTVADLAAAMESIAPLALAEEWDNVGLLVGDASARVNGPVVITIDLTPAVIAEAESLKAGAVIAYHPPIFTAIKRLTAAEPRQHAILRAVRAGMAVYSPHTALDSAPGGMGDWLADCALPPGKPRAADRRALVPKALPRPMEEAKIVTFVPAADVDKVRAGLASAGAGTIGKYTVCSFASEGTGTFFGAADSKPAVGKPGALESVREVRLEMVLAQRAVPLALELLRQFHPYEEAAVDVYPLLARPRRDTGSGRRLVLDQPVTLAEMAARMKKSLRATHVQVAPAPQHGEKHTFTHVALCPGAGASLLDAAARERCELFVTGEMKHHEVLEANARGVSVLLGGHSTTERGYLPTLAARLGEMLPKMKFQTAASDRVLMQTV
ncbi:MAG TPA: Nif3-like dinuclear metal center hexameric protein [Phycisphaerales bacterium]|nr:Nif3-like dinuclear metal center hexameric protein [Phycisphaerales bacterium]